MQEHAGRCHCGALAVSYRSRVPAAETEVRACQCSFCLRHGSRAVSDPSGHATFHATDPALLQRYSFGLRTAEYLLCRHCGSYLGALMTEAGRAWAVVNIANLDDVAAFGRPVVPAVYDAEDEPARRARRRERWTPATLRTGPGN